MANEREYEQGSSSKLFYGIDSDGKLFRKANAEDIAKGKNIKEHIKQKGDKAGEIEIRKMVSSIYGYRTAFWIKSSDDFGDFLVVELFENGETAVLQMQLNSSFADDLIRKVPNMKAGNKYELQSWKMQATDQRTGKVIPDKFIRGVSVKDETGNKIEKYISKEIQLKILPLAKVPLYDAESESQSKAFWKMYFMLLTNEFKMRVIPKAHQGFAEWFEENKESYSANPINSDYSEPNLKNDDLNNSEDLFPVIEPVFVGDVAADDDLPF